MKLNFWQIVGIIVIIIAVVLIFRRRTADPVIAPPTGTPATAPAAP